MFYEFSMPLEILFRRTFELKRVPEDWKKVIIRAVFNKGNKHWQENVDQ